MASLVLKLSLLAIAGILAWFAISAGIGGAAGGAAAMAGGAGMLLAKGLRTPLSTIEATICVAFAVGFTGGSLPFLMGICAVGSAMGVWAAAVAVTGIATWLTFRLWPPGQHLNPVRGMTLLMSLLGAGFAAFSAFEFFRVTCGAFSFFPGLAAALIAIFAVFVIGTRRAG